MPEPWSWNFGLQYCEAMLSLFKLLCGPLSQQPWKAKQPLPLRLAGTHDTLWFPSVSAAL